MSAMINYKMGDMLAADVQALVNTVNTVGVMGKGIALQFKQAFPANFVAYRKACERGEVRLGEMFVFRTGQLTGPRFIINFPTKSDWRSHSHLNDIEAGLRDLVNVICREEIDSIAVPPLGCGNGGLDWKMVRPLIAAAFTNLPGVEAQIYEPAGAPVADRMKVTTARPKMTKARAAIIGLMQRYSLPGYRLSLLEIQKLAYFLQAAGEPLELDFTKQQYGPYSEIINHVLQRMEGHYTRGYGDRSQQAAIEILPDASEEADRFLEDHPGSAQRLARVAELIEGFETPYGMELLATTHWVIRYEGVSPQDVEAVIEAVHAWNAHKRETFQPSHIRTAWDHLRHSGWSE